jgi:hypothetical protein
MTNHKPSYMYPAAGDIDYQIEIREEDADPRYSKRGWMLMGDDWFDLIVSKGESISWHVCADRLVRRWVTVRWCVGASLMNPCLRISLNNILKCHEAKSLYAYLTTLMFKDKKKYCLPLPSLQCNESLRNGFERLYSVCMFCGCSRGQVVQGSNVLVPAIVYNDFDPIPAEHEALGQWCDNCLYTKVGSVHGWQQPTCFDAPLECLLFLESTMRGDVKWTAYMENQIIFTRIRDKYLDLYVVVDIPRANIHTCSVWHSRRIKRNQTTCDGNENKIKLFLMYNAHTAGTAGKVQLKDVISLFNQKLPQKTPFFPRHASFGLSASPVAGGALDSKVLLILQILDNHPFIAPDLETFELYSKGNDLFNSLVKKLGYETMLSQHSCPCRLPNLRAEFKRRLGTHIRCRHFAH